MSNIKLSEAVSRFIDKRPKEIKFNIWEVAEMVDARYDYEEFGDLNIETVAEWISKSWGWNYKFTPEEAKTVCDIASNDGFRGASGWKDYE